MENVPRVAKIFEQELRPGGKLSRFRSLGLRFAIVDFEKFGLPQRRRRCIAGNFDFELFQSYTEHCQTLTLGKVINALSTKRTVDPVYGLTIQKAELRDHVIEEYLSREELRINRAAKLLHPIYNGMSFPDPLNKSVRTIMATCTRVSRESIIVEEPRKKGNYRRLTIRERASLQGFPLNFQFFGKTHAEKLRLVGNAMPPLLAFYLGHAFQSTLGTKLPSLKKSILKFSAPESAPETDIPSAGEAFREKRRFRFAIPKLRLKSGVRFELANSFDDGNATWRIRFYFGSAKSIKTVALDRILFNRLMQRLSGKRRKAVVSELNALKRFLNRTNSVALQKAWTREHRSPVSPFLLLDKLSQVGGRIESSLNIEPSLSHALISDALAYRYPNEARVLVGRKKLLKHASVVAAGLLVGSLANGVLQLVDGRTSPRLPARNYRRRLPETLSTLRGKNGRSAHNRATQRAYGSHSAL